MEERGGAGFGNESRGERVVDEHHVGVVLVAACDHQSIDFRLHQFNSNEPSWQNVAENGEDHLSVLRIAVLV